jgi:DNA-binding transcriptional regulator YiaG
MPNLSQALKTEISRISRHEIKTSIRPLHSSTIGLKKTVAELKKRIGVLESENKRLLSSHKTVEAKLAQVSPEEVEKIRITSKSIRALRAKLGLSQEEFGKLIGVSSQNVFVMEHKDGRLRFRGNTLNNIMAVKGIGKREAKKRLEEIDIENAQK